MIKRNNFFKSCLLFFVFLPVLHSCSVSSTTSEEASLNPDEVLAAYSSRLLATLESEPSVRLPRSVEEGKVRYTSAEGWTSGFLPGILWMMNDQYSDGKWESYAKQYTEKLEEVQYLTSHHDLGFMLNSSYGKGHAVLEEETYQEVLINGAKSLASRYDPLIGMIKSWDRPGKWQYPVIIDNMMNLEYLFWATKATGDSSFYNLALSHAKRSLNDHYRDDFSCYHVIDYDTLTGDVIWKGTHQGLANESVWARGQAWGLYGFTMAYRETEDSTFLTHAQNVATFLLNHEQIPSDKVPYWDLKDPEIPNAPRDVSAAAIIASALLELSEYVPDQSKKYIDHARQILSNLSNSYLYDPSLDRSFFFLDQSVGNKPKNGEVSIPIIYADYYFVEAVLRLKEIDS